MEFLCVHTQVIVLVFLVYTLAIIIQIAATYQSKGLFHVFVLVSTLGLYLITICHYYRVFESMCIENKHLLHLSGTSGNSF